MRFAVACRLPAAIDKGPFQVPLQELLDGPNVHFFRVSQQLGSLSSYARPEADWSGAQVLAKNSSVASAQEAPQYVASVQGMHVDFMAATGSLILLSVLLALSFDRILGLDRVFAQWFQAVRRQSKARQQVSLDATKQRLEQLLQDSSGDET